MKLSEIQELIKFVAKSGVNEVELQTKDVKIVIRTKNGNGKYIETPVIQATIPVAQPAAQVQAASAAETKTEKKTPPATPVDGADESKYITIKAPMIGTFYRASGPDKPAFVNVGDEVAPGKALCVIEAMKLFNEIESDIKGKIVKVLVNDATPVEFDQPMFLVDPS